MTDDSDLPAGARPARSSAFTRAVESRERSVGLEEAPAPGAPWDAPTAPMAPGRPVDPWSEAAGRVAVPGRAWDVAAAQQAGAAQGGTPFAGRVLGPERRPVYDGKLGELYVLYLSHLLFSLLTAGFYRFWGRTRIRRYLWSHMSIFGDRFEYRGRGIELFVGFWVAMGLLAAIYGVLVGGYYATGGEKTIGQLLRWLFATPDGALVTLWVNFVIAFVLLPVGAYSGLRYKLNRTRWRGVRSGLAGSALRYGGLSMGLTVANAMTARLLQPFVDTQLIGYRMRNARFGDRGFRFSGMAGDIYGRYIAYCALVVLAWILLAVALFTVGLGVIGGFNALVESLGGLGAWRDPLLIGLAALGLYALYGVMILPVRCWYRAYLIRYLVGRTELAGVRFGSGLSTSQMWGFMVLNYLIVLATLGLGWPWVVHRQMKLYAQELAIYGSFDGSAVRQVAGDASRIGEGLLDMFDPGAV